MGRGIDHLVICFHDLEAAGEAFRSMGFVTTPRARHDWGTDNTLVQFDGCFLELLTVARPERIVEPTATTYSFGAFNRDYLAKREGIAQMVLESRDAAADRAAFQAAGLKTYEAFGFERKARLPDGTEVTVAFSLAFTGDGRMPEAGFFTCQQHAPEHFWKAEYQAHANGARTIDEVAMVAEDPTALRDFFIGLQGEDTTAAEAGMLTVRTPRGTIAVMTPDRFAERYDGPESADAPDSPHFAGITLRVSDLDAAERCLSDAGFAAGRTGNRLLVDPARVYGCRLAFSE